MATPLTSMLRGKQKWGNSFNNIYRRCYASKRKKIQKDEQTDKVHMKSLFEGQKVNEKTARGGKSAARSYRAMLEQRHEEAARSVLVRVPVCPQDVCDSLRAVGPIHKAYSLHKGKNYLLVEFQRRETVEKLMQHVSYFPDACQMPVRSRLLYAMSTMHVQRHRPGQSIVPEVVTNKELSEEDFIAAESTPASLYWCAIRWRHCMKRVASQDIGYRLRFFVCSVIKDLIRTSMPFCRVEPFGSSSNGFGWDGCDLDMMVTLRPPDLQINSTKRFRFLTKRGSEEERVFGQQCLDLVGEMVRSLLPSTHSINKVLNARVPIIKFHHEATALDCDLSYVNMSGRKMSELMYLLGETDRRVRVLMTTVKQWAKSCDLTRGHPGPWPANFTLLTLLVLFLQTRSPPVLPPLRHLQDLAGPGDHFIIDDVDYAFVTDVSKVPKSTNTQTLDELLKEFFHFYGHFDFGGQGLSLIEGSTFPRQTPSPMYIENPLDISHNVSINVSPAYVTRMQEAMLQAVHCLESKSVPDTTKPWGLLCLFHPASQSHSPAYSVASLFEGEGEGGDVQQLEEENGVHGDTVSGVTDSEGTVVQSSDSSQDLGKETLSCGGEKGSAVS
ncbi:poly(A) RNA polymerase, mitochondrial-like [Babylonia areolata]|uniref:poly(A) RNA polymerase, mitochondrial-like n=1 Tax=Babylonia areolata TaxID=304850 RepID=UPI003FD4AC14